MHYQNERNYGCRVSDDWEYRGNKVAIIENELILYFKENGFTNIISEENNSKLLGYDKYLTIDPIDGTRNFINGINKVVIMVSFIDNNKCIFSIIYDPVQNNFYHSFKNKIFKNHKLISPKKYPNHIGFLGSHAKEFFKNENPSTKNNSTPPKYTIPKYFDFKDK